MLKKFAWLFAGIPVAIVLIVLSVTNRHMVTLRLDPFNAENPALAVTLPFFQEQLSVVSLAARITGTGAHSEQRERRLRSRPARCLGRRHGLDVLPVRRRVGATPQRGRASR